MAHPFKATADKAEADKAAKLDLPTAGAATGEGRLQKMRLHEENEPEQNGEPESPDEGDDLEQLEGEQE